MFSKFKVLISNSMVQVLFQVILICSLLAFILPTLKEQKPDVLKNYGDGIQNHLTWSIKGECFFVRPHTDETVYLIRVADCDKK